MSAPVCQFVDRVGTGAVTRLNLNDGKQLRLLLGPDFPGPDFSPPALKRAVVNTLMAEGAFIPASAYDNRIIRLPLRVKACSEEEMAEILETLHRELDRGQNILKWHPTYNSRPVYFRTFRSPDYRLDQVMEGRGELNATLALMAEPFAYGDYVEQTGAIDNDPAASVNPISFQITGAEGDVPTPLFFHLTHAGYSDSLLAVRRHGTPALYFKQFETMGGVDADTTLQANDPLMSGPGQNWLQTTFVADPTMITRARWIPCPSAASDDDYRGTYRVFARVELTVGTDDVQMRIGVASKFFTDAVQVPQNTGKQWVDLGLVPIPASPDPVYNGYIGTILSVLPMLLNFQAQLVTGTGQLNWDYAVLVPADEELLLVDFQIAVFDGNCIDGPNDICFSGELDGPIRTQSESTSVVGSIPLVTPGQANLYVFCRGLKNNVLAWSSQYTARYWPRYLYIR